MESQQQTQINASPILLNFLRVLTMLTKGLERKARQTYHDSSQYPDIYFQIQSSLQTLRSWIQTNRIYCGSKAFNILTGTCLDKLGQLTAIFILQSCSAPLNGKKRYKKSRLISEHNGVCKSINEMLAHLKSYLHQLQLSETEVGIEIEKALYILCNYSGQLKDYRQTEGMKGRPTTALVIASRILQACFLAVEI